MPTTARASGANARTNRVENKIRFTQADLTKLPRRSAKQYDVVCANLLANLLIAERDRTSPKRSGGARPDGAPVGGGDVWTRAARQEGLR